MKVLLSIHPEHAEKILNGTKHYEYRKKYFKTDFSFNQGIQKVLIYATKPTGLIVGEFIIQYTRKGSPCDIWSQTKNLSGMSYDEYFSYFGQSEIAYAMRIKNTFRYDKPLTLEEVGVKRAPQSFMYID